jgi:hypothetical protein
MPFHLRDIVREKKTGRHGKIDELREEMFRVMFSDNQDRRWPTSKVSMNLT